MSQTDSQQMTNMNIHEAVFTYYVPTDYS